MSKCISCRRNEAVFTRWERIRGWLFVRLFPEDYKDCQTNARLEGWAEGYKKGREMEREHNDLAFRISHAKETL